MVFAVKEIEKLHLWFEENKRDFPWRQERTPYKVWISEVMLQQTRASVVVPYFIRWMEIFPDVEKLAQASLEQVMKVWEGLGYYSRARRLHEGAREICSRFSGCIPSSREDLHSIQGLGSYTVGAILSFGFSQRAPAVDGNVMRVLSRYFLIEENISKASVRKLLDKRAEEFLDLDKPWVSSEALIELGATICSLKPSCYECPLKTGCLAFKENKMDLLPIKNSNPEPTFLYRRVAIIEANGFFLIKKETEGKVMAGLYEFPYFEMKKSSLDSLESLREIENFLKCKPHPVRTLSRIKHTFTRYKVELYPIWFRLDFKKVIDGWEWISFDRFSQIPFSSGHKKIMEKILLELTQ